MKDKRVSAKSVKKTKERIHSSKGSTRKPVQSPSNQKIELFPIVAIGASAGGLEAMTQLLKHLPSTIGMAFIYVQHLSPDHESILASLLSKTSKMPVREITDMTLIEPDNVYVMPADKEMNVVDGKIKLSPRPQGRLGNLLIDVFFTSLAEKHRENVIGVILSGSATDGTRGMKAVKDEGGLTFAQDDTAKFGSMPKSAIGAGVVDYVLSPELIAKELIRLSKHPYIKSNGIKKPTEDEIDNNNSDLKFILTLLQKSFGVNFGLYKMNTIKRRIIRRMLLHKIKTLKEYSDLLNEKKEETEILFNDLLINVTYFFREPEACRYLKTALFPKILKVKKPGEAFRIWVTACSTGEEVYSIAMMLLEIQDTKFRNIPVQIFATDISAPAVSKARIGVYTKQEVEQVSSKRLQRFFTRSNGGYRIAQTVRDMCVFAPHNILNDPPFSRVDFISCCNLLIYFDIDAQKKAIATFHYALNPDGYLLLGKSETVGSSTQLFSAFHKKLKIYSRKKNSGAGILPPPDTRFSRLTISENFPDTPNKTVKSISNASALDNAVNALLLSRYVPASVIINQQMEILQFRGSTSLFLEHPEGRATLNILKMARPEILFELRNAISKAIKLKKPVQKKGIELNGGRNVITLEAVPLGKEWGEPVLLILFTQQELEHFSQDTKKPKSTQAVNERKITRLEEEMSAYRDELRSISHNHEAAMEELQSANEEVVSSNEELRSINEELETSKEEIQSANEELATTNQELQARNELLNESYHYSEAIISTIHDPMIILDKDIRVKTANKSFYKLFRITEEETEGILLYELGNRQWNIPKLRELLEDIISKNSSFKDFEMEQAFPKIGKVVLRLNAKRVVQQAHREQLILLAIADVTQTISRQRTEKKLLEDQIEAQTKIAEASQLADKYIRNVFLQAPVSVVVYKGPSFIIDLVNDKGIEMWGVAYKDAIGKPLFEVSPELKEQGMEKILNDVYASGEPYIANEFSTRYNRNGELYDGFFNFVIKPVHGLDGSITSIVAVGADVTQEVIARRKIEESEFRYHNLIYSSTSLVAILHGKNMMIEIANDAILQSWGKGKDVIGKSLFTVLPEIVEQGFEDRLHEVFSTGKPFYAYELPVYLNRNGKKDLVYYTFVYQAQRNIKGEIEGVAIIGNEVTPQAIYRQKIKESELRYSSLTKALTQVVWITDSKGGFIEPQNSWEEFTGQAWEEHQGWGWANMIHEEDRQEVQNLLKNALEHKVEYKSEGRVWSKKHNSFRYFEAAAVFLEDDQGNVKEWVGTITDVHEQKMAEEKLKEAARQFRFIADAMPQKVWTADAEGNRNYFNQQWIDYTGVGLDELRNLGMESVVHPDDLEKMQNYWKQSIATGDEFELEIRLRARDGAYQWHLTRGEAYRDENGQINLWVGTNTEIQKQKLQSLEFESAVHQRTKELQEANDALQIANQQVALSLYNKRFLTEFSERFSSYKLHDEFFNSLVLYIADLTKMDYVFVGKIEGGQHDELVIETIALTAFGKLADNITYSLPDGPREQVIQGTVFSYPKNSRVTFPENKTLIQFNVEGYIGYPLFDTRGNANGLIAVMHEKEIEDPETVTSILKIVAKRTEVEMERIKYEEELEKNNKILQQKNEELRIVNKELESFAYVSSHDLQEPLRKIQIFVQRITETESKNLSEKGKEHFDRVIRAADRMQVLIEDLLTFSRISIGKAHVETIDLEKIIEDVKTELKEVIEEKKATIEIRQMCGARIIPFQFHQLMQNLINNALKFSDPMRPPHITIESKITSGSEAENQNLLPNHKYCHISVEDNGIGFEHEFEEQVFEVFQRLHGQDEYPGTGIGLAIAKKIVENHHGIISATSELNKGTKFDIYLPVDTIDT